jgi:hypothetical protein
MHKGFGWGNLKERDNIEDLGVNESVIRIKMDLKELGWNGVGWVDVTQEKKKQFAVVKTLIKLRVHKIWRITWIAEKLLASQGGIYFLDLVNQ